jgi:hypothetical protein
MFFQKIDNVKFSAIYATDKDILTLEKTGELPIGGKTIYEIEVISQRTQIYIILVIYSLI